MPRYENIESVIIIFKINASEGGVSDLNPYELRMKFGLKLTRAEKAILGMVLHLNYERYQRGSFPSSKNDEISVICSIIIVKKEEEILCSL
jgi:hypothetical protein